MLKNPSQTALESQVNTKIAEQSKPSSKFYFLKNLASHLPINRLVLLAILGLGTPLLLNACGEEKEESTVNHVPEVKKEVEEIVVKLQGKIKGKKAAIKYAIRKFSKKIGIKPNKIKKMYHIKFTRNSNSNNSAIVSFEKNEESESKKHSKFTVKKDKKKARFSKTKPKVNPVTDDDADGKESEDELANNDKGNKPDIDVFDEMKDKEIALEKLQKMVDEEIIRRKYKTKREPKSRVGLIANNIDLFAHQIAINLKIPKQLEAIRHYLKTGGFTYIQDRYINGVEMTLVRKERWRKPIEHKG